MSTSVHLPKPLLEAIDRRARALRISRNRLIVRTLEQAMSGSAGWSPDFFERLEETDPATQTAVDELLAEIRSRRSSKPPRSL